MKDVRDTSRDYAVITDIPEEDKRVCRNFNLNKCLKIVLYGDPYSDSRPKPNMKTGGIALVNQNKMKKTFKEFYNRCELLQNMTIMSPYLLKGIFYLEATNIDKKRFKKCKKYIQDLFYKEKLAHMGEKDVDNMIKIHNDIMLQDEFRITLTDGFNIGTLYSPKFITPDNPRAEIYVYFSDKEKNEYYIDKIHESNYYKKWLLSYKNYKYIECRSVDKQLKHMKKVIFDMCKDIKKEKEMRKKIALVTEEFKWYKAEDIKELANVSELTSKEFTRIDAEYKLSLMLFKDIPLAYSIIKEGGKAIYDETDTNEEIFF